MITRPARTQDLTLLETVERLAASPTVLGIAYFGSRSSREQDLASDYDLFLLVDTQPVEIFQMLTYIDGRMADIVISEWETADRVLGLTDRVEARSAEGMLITKMWDALIVYDPTTRLAELQEQLHSRNKMEAWLRFATVHDQYATWFWQNHGLLHIKRMMQSSDPIYQTAADMLLLSCLADLCRSYYIARGLLWQGEKAALRYLQHHDPDFLNSFRTCLAETDRRHKIAHYAQLLTTALAPIGALWMPGDTATYLRDPSAQPGKVDEALTFWEGLLQG